MPASCRPSDSVDVGVRVQGEVKVDHVGDELKVDPASNAGLLVAIAFGFCFVLVL